MQKNVCFEIKSLDNMIMRKVLMNVKENREEMISPVQLRIMEYLFQNRDREIYQRDIEKNFLVRRSTASGILKTMEKKGMILRCNSSIDKRANRLIITDKYLNCIEKIEKNIGLFQNNLCRDITDEELNMFFKIIDVMKKNLSEK